MGWADFYLQMFKIGFDGRVGGGFFGKELVFVFKLDELFVISYAKRSQGGGVEMEKVGVGGKPVGGNVACHGRFFCICF